MVSLSNHGPRTQNTQRAAAGVVAHRRQDAQRNCVPGQRASRVDFRHEYELIERHRGP